MPKYSYTAKSFDGQEENGTFTASNEHQLAQYVKSRGLVLVTAFLDEEKKKGSLNLEISLPFLGGVSSTEKILMIRNMGVMFSTGLSLVKIFDILSTQTKNKQLKKALTEIKEKINTGESFSDALAGYPAIFSELFCNMIKVGEESGTLDEVFQILALQLTKEHELKSKILNAMTYPMIILAVMMIVGGVVVTMVLPNLNIFFSTLNVELPIYTRILLTVGNFLSANWYLVFVVPLGLVAVVFLLLKSRSGKRAIDTVLLRIPVVSPIVKKSNSAFLVRSLSSLIASGVSLVRALEITAKTVGNHYFQDAILDASKRIKKGDKLSAALRPYQHLFPFGVVEMIEVGEETGKTSAILKKLADFYEQEAVNSIEKLATLIEPIMIIFLGLAVGIFAFSIIEPMYSSLKSIGA